MQLQLFPFIILLGHCYLLVSTTMIILLPHFVIFCSCWYEIIFSHNTFYIYLYKCIIELFLDINKILFLVPTYKICFVKWYFLGILLHILYFAHEHSHHSVYRLFLYPACLTVCISMYHLLWQLKNHQTQMFTLLNPMLSHDSIELYLNCTSEIESWGFSSLTCVFSKFKNYCC